jgi:hypothetical protein
VRDDPLRLDPAGRKRHGDAPLRLPHRLRRAPARRTL